MIGEIIKNGAISLGIAIVFAFAISYFLELSAEGIRNITFISIVVCLALGQGIRFIGSRGGAEKMKTLILISLAAISCLLGGCSSAISPKTTTTARTMRADIADSKDIADSMDIPEVSAPPRKYEKPTPIPKKAYEAVRVATRGYLYTAQATPTGYGAYAYLVFNADPGNIERERCLALCEAFSGHLPATTQSSSIPERESQMVTFWPLSGSFIGDNPDCDRLIANYDLAFAARIAASINKQGVRGPLLVAWTQPFGESSSEALVLDMSSFAKDDLGRALLIWKTRIAMNPALWQQGWKTVVVKEEIRNLIAIGPGIVTVVATFFNKPKPE